MIDYDGVHITYEYIDGDDLDYTYKIDEDDVMDFLKNWAELDLPDEINDLSDKEYEEYLESDEYTQWIEDNYEKLISKYIDEMADHFEEAAVEDYFFHIEYKYSEDPATGRYYKSGLKYNYDPDDL